MNNVKRLILCLSVLGPVFLFATTEPIKIGFVGPRTGPAAATGTAFEEGINLALDVLKAKGGVNGRPIEVVFEDTGGVPEKAVAAFEKLVTKDKVAIVVGESHSSSALAEIEVANRTHTPFIVAEAWHDDIMKKGYPTVFRAGPSNSEVVNNCIAKFFKDARFKRAFIIAENTDWGKGISALTEAALKSLRAEYGILQSDRESKDYYSQLHKIKVEKPEIILAYIYSAGLHSFISQAKEVGVSPAALILDGAGPPSLWPDFWSNVGKSGELELFVSAMHESVHPTPVSKQFWNDYKKKYGKDPGDYKIRSAYNVVLLGADAIGRAKSTESPAIVNALEHTDFVGATGHIKFGSQPGTPSYHQWSPQMLVGQWQSGKQVVVFPKKFATGALKKTKK